VLRGANRWRTVASACDLFRSTTFVAFNIQRRLACYLNALVTTDIQKHAVDTPGVQGGLTEAKVPTPGPGICSIYRTMMIVVAKPTR
jgi:hypothetical protein